MDSGALARSAAARARMIQAAASLPAILDRLLPLARRLVGFMRTLVRLTAVAVVAILASMVIITRPSTIGPFIVLAILAVILAVPPFMLKLLHEALGEVIELPQWLLSTPDLLRTHGSEIAQLAARSRADLTGSAATGRLHPVRDLLASGKLLLAAHRDLPEYGSALRLMSIPFLLVVAVSLVVAVIEWFLGLALMLVALISLALG